MVGDILAKDTATQTGVYSVRQMVEIQLQKRVQIDYWVCAWAPSHYLWSGCETLWSGRDQVHLNSAIVSSSDQIVPCLHRLGTRPTFRSK